MKKLVFPFMAAVLLLLGAGSALVGCKNSTTTINQAALDHQNKYRAIDDSIIMAYLTRHNYGPGSYQRTDAGLYLVTLTENTQGAVAATGKQVAVKYIGRLVRQASEDVVFDSSINGRTLCDCGNFTVGSGTITGWAQALPLMHQGERKLLFVPSYLAYGITGSGSIGADTPLLFDMEILAVSK